MAFFEGKQRDGFGRNAREILKARCSASVLSSAEYSNFLRRKRYLNDPEYRANVLATCKRSREKAFAQNGLQREIVRLKDSIRKKREAIQRRSIRVLKCERDLLALVKRRQVVGSRWDKIRTARG